MTTLDKEIREKQGNLWAWNGINPYRAHPLFVLGLENKHKITAPMINRSAKQLMDRERVVGNTETKEIKGMSARRSQELLIFPATRVICELMRIPPVQIPKAEIEELKKLAADHYKYLNPLPPPTGINCNWEVIANRLSDLIAQQELDVPEIDAPKFSENPALKRQVYSGISFRQRKRKAREYGDEQENDGKLSG